MTTKQQNIEHNYYHSKDASEIIKYIICQIRDSFCDTRISDNIIVFVKKNMLLDRLIRFLNNQHLKTISIM